MTLTSYQKFFGQPPPMWLPVFPQRQPTPTKKMALISAAFALAVVVMCVFNGLILTIGGRVALSVLVIFRSFFLLGLMQLTAGSQGATTNGCSSGGSDGGGTGGHGCGGH